MNRSLFRLVVVLAVVFPAVGCAWLEGLRGPNPPVPRGTETLAKVEPEKLVAFINERAARLQTIDYDEIRVVARDGLVPLPALQGNLTAGQPRYFRMTGSARAVSAKVDLGSNPEQFWVYFDVPASKPLYVFASHTDFESGKAKLPGGIPFEPDWVMQALGMIKLPPTNQYSAPPPDQKHRTYSLTWPAIAPGGPPPGKDPLVPPGTPPGIPVVKEIVFDADPAADPKPQVKKHIIRDMKGNVICSAEIKFAKTALVSADPHGPSVQFPTLMVLRWEEHKFELQLELKGGEVNKPFTDEKSHRLFTRPTFPNASPIDLAQYTFTQK